MVVNDFQFIVCLQNIDDPNDRDWLESGDPQGFNWQVGAEHDINGKKYVVKHCLPIPFEDSNAQKELNMLQLWNPELITELRLKGVTTCQQVKRYLNGTIRLKDEFGEFDAIAELVDGKYRITEIL